MGLWRFRSIAAIQVKQDRPNALPDSGPSSPTPSLANGYVRSLFGQCCMWRALLVLISLAAQSGSSELDCRFFIHPFHWNLDDYSGTM